MIGRIARRLRRAGARAPLGAPLRPLLGLALAATLSVTPPAASALGDAGALPPLATATVVSATAPPATSVQYEEESIEAFEAQLHGHALAAAEFNKVAHHLHLTLRDGRHLLVDYPGHEQPKFQAELLAAGIPVTIEYTPKATTSTHHTVRYVAAGILVVLLILLGVLLVARRRRLAGLEQQGAGATHPAEPPSSG